MSIFLVILLGIAVALLLMQSRTIKTKEAALTQAQTTAEQSTVAAQVREAQLQRDLEQISQYRVIPDAKQHAHQMRVAAEAEAAALLTRTQGEAIGLRAAAAEELRQARVDGKDMRYQASVKARTLKTKADGGMGEISVGKCSY